MMHYVGVAGYYSWRATWIFFWLFLFLFFLFSFFAVQVRGFWDVDG